MPILPNDLLDKELMAINEYEQYYDYNCIYEKLEDSVCYLGDEE